MEACEKLSSVQNRFNYLIPLFLIPIVGTFGHYVAPNEAIFKGQDLGNRRVISACRYCCFALAPSPF